MNSYFSMHKNNETIEHKKTNVRPDWLLKRRVSFTIHLRATDAGFAPEHLVIVASSVNSS